MHYPIDKKGKIRFSILGAAAIAFMLHKQRDAFGLTLFSDKIEWSTPIKSTKNHLNKLLLGLEDLLEKDVQPRKSKIADIIHEIAEINHRRSLIILFSDMFDSQEDTNELFMALQHLKHNKHEVILFHVTDRQTEKDFSFEERPYEFIDLESGEKLRLKPSQVKEKYLEEIDKFYKELSLKCAQYKIDFVEADINSDIDDVLRSYMLKRSKMT